MTNYPIASVLNHEFPIPPIRDFFQVATVEYIPSGGAILRKWLEHDGPLFEQAELTKMVCNTATAFQDARHWKRCDTDAAIERVYMNMMFQNLRYMAQGEKYQFLYIPSVFARNYDRLDIRGPVNIMLEWLTADKSVATEHLPEAAALRGACIDYLNKFSVSVRMNNDPRPVAPNKEKQQILALILNIIDICGEWSENYQILSSAKTQMVTWVKQRFNAPGVPLYQLENYPHGIDALNRNEFIAEVEKRISQLTPMDLCHHEIMDLQYLQVYINASRKLVYTDLTTGRVYSVRVVEKTTLKPTLPTDVQAVFNEWIPKIKDARFSQVLAEDETARLSIICYGTI